jgi:hypothetical protein
MNNNLDSAIRILTALAKLQRWEIVNSNLLRSASGRQLYYGLIRHLSNENNELMIDSLKDIYYDDGIQLTERGVRLTIRTFEAEGALSLERGDDDKRSRRIFLTDKLQELMLVHADVMRKILNEDHLVIQK